MVHFKPHPEALLKALKKYDMDPRDCLYVGESPYDVEAGIASGIFTVAVTSGGCSKETLLACHPDLLIEDIRRIKTIFLTGSEILTVIYFEEYETGRKEQ